ncbi:hypothetical protein [Pseudaminobacter soli (ex Li et al. 2025)]|uniref:Norphogenetic protein n=1 Tax=Pseudaminobacter soli (ex Li et al. 2025) TaxID=1295366 RepID=A0A2P7S010_9HYPH|nr:hypothetical protein [Mesorhizobium soli]PSJ55766.1 hypothetical protein C7I85_26100 [Mesorhizobium soli]
MPDPMLDWSGETVVILAGGPSVLDLDLSLLLGHRVIAINSAWKLYPLADVLFFADGRWYDRFKPMGFSGLCVTTGSVSDPAVVHLAKVAPTRLATLRGELALNRSSVTGAINLAVHFGAGKIVLLGVDGKFVDGRRHGHDDEYPWHYVARSYEDQTAEFRQVAPSIPVPVINCSPVSNLKVWPRMSLAEALKIEPA